MTRRLIRNYLERKGDVTYRGMKNRSLVRLIKVHEPEFSKEHEGLKPVKFLRAFHEEIKRRRAQSYEEGSVYIIGNRTWGLCKIGTSKIPGKRLAGLQTGCPFDLAILALFENRGRDYEALLQERAQPYHERGGWFRIEGRLKDFLDNHDTPG